MGSLFFVSLLCWYSIFVFLLLLLLVGDRSTFLSAYVEYRSSFVSCQDGSREMRCFFFLLTLFCLNSFFFLFSYKVAVYGGFGLRLRIRCSYWRDVVVMELESSYLICFFTGMAAAKARKEKKESKSEFLH